MSVHITSFHTVTRYLKLIMNALSTSNDNPDRRRVRRVIQTLIRRHPKLGEQEKLLLAKLHESLNQPTKAGSALSANRCYDEWGFWRHGGAACG